MKPIMYTEVTLLPIPRLHPGIGTAIHIWINDSYLGLGVFIMVINATSKFLGLGRGTNPFYICYAQLKGCGCAFHSSIHIFVHATVIWGEMQFLKGHDLFPQTLPPSS